MNIKTCAKLFLPIVLFAFSAFVSGAESEKYAVLNSWEEGTYFLLQECTNSVFKTVGKTETERDESRLLLNWQIDADSEDSDGNQQFHLKLLRIMMSIRINGKEVVYFDSSNGISKLGILNGIFKQMKEVEVVVYFKGGLPTRVQGSDDFLNNLPEPANDEEKLLLASMKNLTTPDNIKQTFDTLVCLDSPEYAGVGDTWESHTVLSIPVVGDKTVVWNCVLEGVDASRDRVLAKVSGKGMLDFKIDGAASGDVNVRAEDKVVYDTKSCFPTSVDSRVYVTLKTPGNSESKENEETYIGFLKNKLTVAKH